MAVDLSTYTDDELANLRVQVQVETERRQLVATAADRISRINRDCLAAQGVTDGSAWVQPTDASNAYPRGWTVTHNGVQWESLIPANTTMPGDAADPQNSRWWKNLTPPAPPPPSNVPSPWDGEGHPYVVGDLVSYQGKTYKCLQAHTSQPTWDPVSVPALWQVQP